jgi:hypothetical protein
MYSKLVRVRNLTEQAAHRSVATQRPFSGLDGMACAAMASTCLRILINHFLALTSCEQKRISIIRMAMDTLRRDHQLHFHWLSLSHCRRPSAATATHDILSHLIVHNRNQETSTCARRETCPTSSWPALILFMCVFTASESQCSALARELASWASQSEVHGERTLRFPATFLGI